MSITPHTQKWLSQLFNISRLMPSKKKDGANLFLKLPPELLLRIFSEFAAYELVELCLVSRSFIDVAKTPILWEWRLSIDFAFYVTMDPSSQAPQDLFIDEKRLEFMGHEAKKKHLEKRGSFDAILETPGPPPQVVQRHRAAQDAFFEKFGLFQPNPKSYLPLKNLYEPIPIEIWKLEKFYDFYKEIYLQTLHLKEAKEMNASDEVVLSAGPLAKTVAHALSESLIDDPKDFTSFRKCYRLLSVWRETLGVEDTNVPTSALKKFFKKIARNKRTVYKILQEKKYILVALVTCGIAYLVIRFNPGVLKRSTDYMYTVLVAKL